MERVEVEAHGGRGEAEGGEDELCRVCWPPSAKSGEEVSGALSSVLGRQGCRGRGGCGGQGLLAVGDIKPSD